MPKYSPEFRERAVRQLMPPTLRSVASVSRETGVSEPTLYAWKKQFQAKGAVLPSHATGPHGWDATAKLAALMQTALMNETERSAYCRQNGLYVEQLETWKAAFESIGQASDGGELNQSRKTNRELQKELLRKDKALAEAAALLVLSKKVRVIWGTDEAL